MSARTYFPIQIYQPERDFPRQLRQIPWALIAEHEEQALKNHCGQTLVRLADRFGTCAMETVAILENKSFHERWGWSDSSAQTKTKQIEAIERLSVLCREHEDAHRDESHGKNPPENK